MQRDEILTEIKALEDQEAYYSAELDKVTAAPQIDTNTQLAYEDELRIVRAKLSDRQKMLAEIEGATETAQAELIDSFESLVIPGTDRIIPISYLLMTDDIGLDDKIAILTSNLEQKLVNAAIVQKSLERENESLKERVEDLESENFRLARENDRIEMISSDLQVKLDNAGTQIEEKDAEIKRINEDTAKLREQLTNTSTATRTTFTAAQTESIAEKLAKRPAVYNVRWADDLKRTHYIVTLAETGEDKTISRLELGLYREVNAEEAERFRAEQAAIQAEAEAQAALENSTLVTYELPPSITETNAGVSEHSTNGAMADEAVTRGEFNQTVNEIMARLSQLEQSAVNAA